MNTQHTITRLARAALLLLAFVPLACGRADGDQQNAARAPFELSDEEVRLARQVAEEPLHIPADPPVPLERVCFIKVDLLPGTHADDPARRVNVIHYRYHGDETIITTVDLHTLDILKVETYRHFPTALAAEELARAERLARADARLQSMFDSSQVIVEGRPFQATAPADALFGHRVVHLLLRDGANYRVGPRILVDLTREIALVDESLFR